MVKANGESKGFEFVQFDSEDSAMASVGTLHDKKDQWEKVVSPLLCPPFCLWSFCFWY